MTKRNTNHKLLKSLQTEQHKAFNLKRVFELLAQSNIYPYINRIHA